MGKLIAHMLIGNWKTSLLGWLGGALIAKAGGMTWSAIGTGGAVGLLGTLSKDFNVSGTGK